ncbi:MAG: DNA polymerase IV [Deltaproteobacteria bacterium]|nr:DNA polymerase IV [Candidatus Zymogenaceae bacterium]
MARLAGDRTILHIDMDAFFASIEQAVNPALVGKPIAVIGSKKRTVIVTSSYEARKKGVKTGMTAGEGMRACPDLILVPGNNRRYIDASVRILAIMRDYSPDVEVFSIDEAFVDVTGSLRLFGGAERIAREIKRRISEDLNITCSVGVAPNKLVAKLVSGLKKPDGLTIVTQDEVGPLMDGMPIEEICGIGSRLGKVLKGLGIVTCGDLGRYPVSVLKGKFGVTGERLHYMALGVDETPIVPIGQEDAAKSIGHSMTFPYDVDDQQGMHRYLLLLSAKVGRRVRKAHCSGRTIYLYVRFSDFTGLGRRHTLPKPIRLDLDIYHAAADVLSTIEIPLPVRLLGVSMTNLVYSGSQLPLLSGERREFLLAHAVDDIKDRYGDDILSQAEASDWSQEAGVISPAWRPQGTRRVDPK